MKSAAMPSTFTTPSAAPAKHRYAQRLLCRVFGHRFANRARSEMQKTDKLCACGEDLIRPDGVAVHVRHNLVCFLGGHSYQKLVERHDHCEYVCNDCGHPLLFRRSGSPYASQDRFHKFVRPRCGWFGHAVHEVTARHELTEYACHCGHSFLLQAKGLKLIRHPLVCMLTGHRISLLTQRNDQLEFRCQDCGHPFCMTEGTDERRHPPATMESPSTNAQGNDWLRLIRFPYHLSFIGVVLGAVLAARGLPLSLLLSLLALYLSFNVLLYGGLYTLNDILDTASDQQHSRKRNRPIQAGTISRRAAALFAVTLTSVGLVSGYVLFPAAVFFIYLVVVGINVCYSTLARRVPWLEIAVNAAPHPLRFAMGAALAGGTAPMALLIGIFWLAFGIAATRRLLEKDVDGWQARKVIESYSEGDLFLLRMLPFCAVFLQMMLDSSIPKAFYVAILAVYVVTVFGVDFFRPIRSYFVELWTK